MKNKSISVVIPTCDRFILLKKAIKSLVNQTVRPDEVIIVNNGKKRLSRSNFSKSLNIKLYNLEPYLGPAIARNFGYKKSFYNNVAFLDDDDTWSQNLIEEFYKNYNKIYSCYLFKSKIKLKNKKLIDYKNPKNRLYLKNLFLFNPGIGGSNIILNKLKIKKKFLFDKTISPAEDKGLIIDLLLNNKKIKFIENSYVVYFRNKKKNSNNMSSFKNLLKNKINFFFKYQNKMKLVTKIKFLLIYIKYYFRY